MRRVVRRVDRLQRLAVLEATVRLGSFSAAARELGMTQPAVTRQVRALERAVGVPLFARTANRSEATPAGLRLYAAVATSFEAIEVALDELEARSSTFVLAATPGLAEQLLVPHLQELAEAVEDVDLRLWIYEREADLAAGDQDAATRFGDGAWPGLESCELIPEVVVPVASPVLADALRLHADGDPAALATAPLLHLDLGDRGWLAWQDWLAAYDVAPPAPHRRIHFHYYPLVLRQAIAGHGVALGWRALVDDLVTAGLLVVVGPEVSTPRGYHLTWSPGRAREPARAIARAVRDLAGPHASSAPVPGPSDRRRDDVGPVTHQG